MFSSANAVALSRVLIPLLGLVVWALFYLNARCAYALPKGGKRAALQLSLVFGSVVIFILQLNLMERLTPGDAYGDYFFWFVFFECGGALVVLLSTLFRERAKSMKAASGAKS
jgi:ascorbate-specific PTS system EIIC-type component UlaA